MPIIVNRSIGIVLEQKNERKYRMSQNYFESKECKEKVSYMLEEYENPDLLNEKSNAYMLDGFILEYNWDDGPEVPYFILNHRNCELGTALKIFYFAEGEDMLEERYKDYQLGHWIEFIEYTYKKIAENDYKSQLIEFKCPLSETYKKHIKPELFTEPYPD